jgi:hypothetical protein
MRFKLFWSSPTPSSRGRRPLFEGTQMSNLFIAYDLDQPGQNYDGVRNAIRTLGQWHQFQFSFFYVHTELTPAEAYNRVAAEMDANDRLAVIDAQSGVVSDWDRPPIEAINAIWFQP